MEMEVELGPRLKSLPYKIKAMSRETASQKASHILDPDLRNYWSTGTNTKEWILLELQEPCLLSHLRIHNKSVLEWEVTASLRYKPETFVKVRSRCEAPRRDMTYSTNYTPTRYVRISCLRGSPIAIFFVQLIGISMPHLEPEFQPVIDHLLPQVISHEQDSCDLHLQLLQDIIKSLHGFVPHLESELTNFAEAPEPGLRFLAMLAGPFHRILQVVSQRGVESSSIGSFDSKVSRNSLPSPAFTVSSNFEPRRSHTSSPATSKSTAFHPDTVFMLLRKAYRESDLATVCKIAARVFHHLGMPNSTEEVSVVNTEIISSAKEEAPNHGGLSDYSGLFGEDLSIPVDEWDSSFIYILDLAAVEEGILHVLYACACEPFLCHKLAESPSDFWLALPLIQALLPALRPISSPPATIDNTFSQWMQPLVQRALSKIVLTLSSQAFHPLLRACAGYFSSFSPAHAKTACVLIDFCSGVLEPWIPQVISKIELAMELLEDLLGVVQGVQHPSIHARSAILYFILALSGYMDDLMAKFKEVKHSILFLIEMLERFLQPVFSLPQPMIDLRNVSELFLMREEHTCAVALNVIRAAVRKPSILPYLELEWRRGSVPPSVILSVLDPHLQLPAGIDFCKCPVASAEEVTSINSLPTPAVGVSSVKSNGQVNSDEVADVAVKIDINKDASLLFAPPELKTLSEKYPIIPGPNISTSSNAKSVPKENVSAENLPMDLKFYNLQVDYAQLLSYEDCKLRASEFRRMAFDLHLQNDINLEAHEAAIDALLLSAECYINPFLMISSAEASKIYNQLKLHERKVPKKLEIVELKKVFGKNSCNLETLAQLEKKRDKVFIQILLQAAQMEKSYHSKVSDGEQIVNLSDNNDESADAITLVRRHQDLLCNFVIKQLQKERHSMHETLIQSLVFLLHSATKLCCAPESVIGIIIGSVEDLNKILVSMFQQHEEGSLILTHDTLYRVQRRWELLQSLIIASSGGGRRLNSRKSFHGLQYGNLVPPLAWLQKIPAFSSSPFPLVRYLGWMAVSRNANLYLEERLFLATDLSQLTYLLSIYTDDLAMANESMDKHSLKSQQSEVTQAKEHKEEHGKDLAFAVLYPEVSFFFPDMHKEFRAFGETILRAVALQLKSVASTAIPELLCWLSDLCTLPFHEKLDNITANGNCILSKGCRAKNARAVILFVLEAIVTRHMEAIVPEIPRVLQLLGSICRRPYSDVSFLHSVLALLKPIIVYSLQLVSEEEKLLNDDSSCNFESLCFDELFTHVRKKTEADGETGSVKVALVIFVLSSFVQDLSFEHKRDLMLSSLEWVGFASTEPTTSFHDYLCAFDQLFEGCKMLLVDNSRSLGVIPIPQSGTVVTDLLGDNSDPLSWFPDNFCYSNSTVVTDKTETDKFTKSCQALMPEEITELSSQLESLVLKLNLSIERCWKLHHQLSRKLAVSSAQCLVYSRYLSAVHNHPNMTSSDNESAAVHTCEDQSLISWNQSLELLAKDANSILENGCWEVASIFIDCLLRVPTLGSLDNVVLLVCSAIKHIMNFAPRITWRLQTDRWLNSLFSKGILRNECGTSLINLLSEMLSHLEPEQRLIALRHVSQLMGLDVNDGDIVFTSLSFDKLATDNRVLSVSDSVISRLVSTTWEQLTVMASSETSLPLRTIAIALLVQYIPYVEHHQLQAFLATTDTLLLGFDISPCRMKEGLLMKLLLALIAGICLYSPAEETSVIPANVWRYVESIAMSKAGTLGDTEKKICQALCKFQAEGNDAKEALQEVLITCPEEHFDPNFGSTRDTIFQVLSNLTSVQAYFDVFDDEVDLKTRELEEAELEMEIIQNEHESYADSDTHNKDADQDRLQQIKDSIHSVGKNRIRKEIIAQRQKKLLLMRTRQKHIEEAALREAQLLQELDRQRILESEREVERQQTLELERAKTNELRYNLSLEKEKQTQRELQRELEHLDSGVRGSRREFSSVHSRARDRYKEKDGVKSGGDSSSRASTSIVQPEVSINNSSTITSMPTVVLPGQRTLSGQLPTILQTRDQVDEYDEYIDSGDTGSTGDPELGSAFDGHVVGGFGASQRHVSRGVKSRQQAVERRERDGRREGKWERKH